MKSIKTLLLISIGLMSNFIFAQTVSLNFESGNINTEKSTCWTFKSLTYSNIEMRISGSWSGRTVALTANSADSSWLKTPWIKPGSGNITFSTRLENDRGTMRGIVLRYIPYNPNASSATKEGTPVAFSTYYFPTPFNINIKNIFVPIPAAIANAQDAYKIQISFIGTGGTSRAFIDNLVIPGTYHSDPFSNCLPLPIIHDADGDGVADGEDAYPNDPLRAYNTFVPSTGFGTYLFEDLWPSLGDYDFNDLVLGYRYQKVTNAQNKMVDLKATYITRAIGGSKKNGFAIQLDGVSPNSISSVTGVKTFNSQWLAVDNNGTESGQSAANIVIFDNAYKIMPSPGGSYVNTIIENPYKTPDTTTVTIEFGLKDIFGSDLSINPYLIVNQDRGKEIHMPNYTPSSKVNTAYFGTFDDNSTQAKVIGGTYYKSKTNLPWGLDIPSYIYYTKENKDFITAYLKFVQWAQSNGNMYSDWYLDLSGYRDNSNLYIR